MPSKRSHAVIMRDSRPPLEVGEICALLGHYAAYSGNSLPTFRDNLTGPIFKGQEIFFFYLLVNFLILEYGSDRLSRKVGNESPVYVA